MPLQKKRISAFAKTSIDDGLTKRPTAIPVDGSVLLIASDPCEFPLKGFVTIESLVGVVSIMGYQFKPGSEGQNVYSPDCNSLVTVRTVEGDTNVNNAVGKLDSLLNFRDRTVINSLRNILNENKPFVILKFDKLKTTLCSFISSIHPYMNIFKVDRDRTVLNKQLLPLSVKMPGKDVEVPRLRIPEQLQSVLDVWTENLTQPNQGQPVIVVCGGKDSGKSTSNRLLINTTLNICESVYYLECDIGQTEFTPPGVLSLVKVTSPVLGPPFTHQRKTVCSYHYGSATPTANPDLYMRCVQLCVEEYQCIQQDKPLIVNTMGWMKDLGRQLLLDTVCLVSPSLIVQLTSNQNSQNIAPVTVGELRQTSRKFDLKMFMGETIQRRMDRVPKIIHLEAPVSTRYNFRMKSTDYRNLTILSHLGANLEPGLTLTLVTSFIVSWKDVGIHMRHVEVPRSQVRSWKDVGMRHVEVPRSQVMYALNANIVALCEGDISKAKYFGDDGPLFFQKNKQPFRWHGYGLVGEIDMVNEEFSVLTSLTLEELARVNFLDIGDIGVPENFLITQLHSRENWLKEGRAVRIGEEPYKFVKSRAKWNRPKEDPEAKDLELFGQWQTELYIPPPAVDGKVPRNAHGNVEMFLPSMLPAGTVHLKVPALNKVAKKLDIDCAPAMVGWDVHCGFSHPLMDGWIVCEEHKDILLAAWDEEQEIIREKEQQKREKRVYDNWRKLIRGMLIKERLKKRFDLEEKPKEDSGEIGKTDSEQTTETTKKATEKATDQQHAWPQNRLINKQHTFYIVEEL